MKVCARRLALSLGCLALLGCGIDTTKYTDYEKDVVARSQEVAKGPANAPRTSDTSFTQALRCMDFMFITYGVRDVSVLVEDIPDPTKKVNAGGKDMLISAVSQMTRRSRAIQLMAFSATDFTLKEVLEKKAQKLEELPQYAIRGSVSAYDESVIKKQGDAGGLIGPFTASKARQGSGSVLGVDLNVINTATLNLVPGVTSRNSVLLIREGEGADGELMFSKFGLNFNFTMVKSEGNAQAMRTLAELAAIELFGKLVKVPYWTCLGTDDKDPGVQAEITDWWESLAADPESLVAFFQTQMRARGLYKGATNGRVDESLIQALEVYQQALGMQSTSSLEFEFFRRYLSADHADAQKRAQAIQKTLPPVADANAAQAGAPAQTAAPAQAPAAAGAQPAAQQVAAVAPGAAVSGGAAGAQGELPPLPRLVVVGSKGQGYVYRRGETYSIDVALDRDTNLYCFLVDENRRVNQFFPNPVQQAPGVRGGSRLSFPGDLPFKFVTNLRGAVETVSCFAVASPLGNQPLAAVQMVRDPEELTAAFRRVAGPRFTAGRYDVRVQ